MPKILQITKTLGRAHHCKEMLLVYSEGRLLHQNLTSKKLQQSILFYGVFSQIFHIFWQVFSLYTLGNAFWLRTLREEKWVHTRLPPCMAPSFGNDLNLGPYPTTTLLSTSYG
jgi:hypothetical protein